MTMTMTMMRKKKKLFLIQEDDSLNRNRPRYWLRKRRMSELLKIDRGETFVKASTGRLYPILIGIDCS